MKKIFIYIALVAGVAIFSACETHDTEDVSEVTFYPVFQKSGENYLYIETGTPYVEPGISASEGGTDLDIVVTGSVDSQTPGVYELTYTATNSDGFSASENRIVAVGNKQVAAARDLSGVYDTSRGGSNEVTKVIDGFYQNTDLLPPNEVVAIMVDLGDGNMIIPPQGTRFGTVVADPSTPGTSATVISEDSFEAVFELGANGIFTVTFTK